MGGVKGAESKQALDSRFLSRAIKNFGLQGGACRDQLARLRLPPMHVPEHPQRQLDSTAGVKEDFGSLS